MGVAWLIFFPLGAMVMRFLSSKPVKIHQGIQIATLIVTLCAGGLGFYLVYLHGGQHFTDFRNRFLKKPLILDHFFGTAILAVACLQGAARSCYARFVKGKSSRWVSVVHVSLGYIIMMCGIINCGFGLLLAKIEMKWTIVCWICGCGLVVIYLGACITQRSIQQGRKYRREENLLSAETRYGVPEYRREVQDLEIPSQRYRQSEQYNRLNYGLY
jgi:hypothetical protein